MPRRRGAKKRKKTEDTPHNNPKRRKKEDYAPWNTTNTLFEKYYREMGIFDGAEMDSLLKAYRTELPTTIRVNETGEFNEMVKKDLEDFRNKLAGVTYVPEEGSQEVPLEPPSPLSWFPVGGSLSSLAEGVPNTAWKFSMSRRFLRKNNTTKAFQNFLVMHNSIGSISRQEAVSMIPPLFLDVQPHHYVLDMCAAPGSKTTQLIEHLHREGWNTNTSNSEIPTGLIIANDSDPQRCHTLFTQLKRIASPCVVVTNHQAQFFPWLFHLKNTNTAETAKESDGTDSNKENEENYTQMTFDRILCDVPCSGDGTLRKNPDIWEKWHPLQATGLHRTQINILWKAFELCKVGGRIVYSTCSLNPVEDEAVVASVLERSKGCLKLVDTSNSLVSLKRRNGITKWRLMDKQGNWYQSWEELPPTLSHLPRSAFSSSHPEIGSFNIERCMRVLPHDQDTGGFFVAVLEKVAALPTKKRVPVSTGLKTNEVLVEKTEEIQEEEKEEQELEKEEAELKEGINEEVGEENKTEQKKKGKNQQQPKILNPEEFFPLPPEIEPHIKQLKEFYGLSDGFPFRNLFARKSTSKDGLPQKVFYLPDSVVEITQNKANSRLRVLNTGIKVLQRINPFEGYRLCQSGLPLALPFITKRIVSMDKADFEKLLMADQGCQIMKLEKNVQNTLNSMNAGPCVFALQTERMQFHCSGARGRAGCTVYMRTHERKLLLQIISPELFQIKEDKDTEPGKEENKQEAKDQEEPNKQENKQEAKDQKE